MSKIDEACEAIIKEFTGNSSYAFEKKAAAVESKEETPKFTVNLPAIVNFRKIASEIRKTAAPVEVSYDDVNEFIKEISK